MITILQSKKKYLSPCFTVLDLSIMNVMIRAQPVHLKCLEFVSTDFH
jgi:hypothetical protein